MPPNLDLSTVETRTIRVGEELEFDLYAAGGAVIDLGEDGHPTDDLIRLQLDPDDGPSNASLTPEGTFRWIPTADQVGLSEFVVIAVDAGSPALADAEVFTVEVLPNRAPNLAAIPDTTISFNQEMVVHLSATDPDNDPLTFLIDPDLVATGAVVEQSGENAMLRWTPSANFADQTIDFRVLVVDTGIPPMSDSESFQVTVMSVGANDDAYSSTTGTLNVDAANGVLANDIDSNGDTLTVTVSQSPANGTLILASDGSFTYTPNGGFRGRDTFIYRAEDGNGDFSLAEVVIDINSAPEAVADAYDASEDATLSINATVGVLANDTDTDGDLLTATIVDLPDHGELTFRDDGSFDYIPEANFHGTVSFTYVANDGFTNSEVVTATITVASVNDAPAALDDAYTTNEDEQLVVAIDSGVLVNDVDTDGDPLTAVLMEDAENGSVALNSDGTFTYSPNVDFHGTDQFSYVASDGELSSQTTNVTITVAGVADPPAATADSYTATEGLELTIAAGLGVLSNDSDADGDALTARLLTGTTHGLLTFNADGSFAYTSDVGFSGTDSFTYVASDGDLESNSVTVELIVDDVNQTPVGVNDSYTVTEDVTLTVDVQAGVLANDSDADGDTLMAVLINGPSHGELSLNSDGSFSYTAAQSSPQLIEFSYQVSDGTLSSSEVMVSLTIISINDVPVAMADTYELLDSETLSVDSVDGVLANDTDVDGDPLTATLVDQPANGTVSLSANGAFVYQANTGFLGQDTFTYRADDGTETSNITVVTVNVTKSNQAPVAADDEYTVGENAVLSVGDRHSLLANDSDPEGDPLTASVADQPENGTLVVNSDGTFTYTPNSGFTGEDSFTYSASDGSASSNVATSIITVTPAGEGAALFGPVTPGNFEDPGLLGIRTDLVTGAPPILRTHVDGDIDYTGYSNPPTYGPHHGFDPQGQDANPGITPRPTGIYTTEQPDEDLIHNLEHGHVWISYNPNLISGGDLQLLETLLLNGSSNPNGAGVGVILTPRAANDTAIALVSWARLMTLDEFDEDTIRNFVETNRGQAPEGFITP